MRAFSTGAAGLLAMWFCLSLASAAAAQAPERLYAELAKLKPEDRRKRLEDGARKEGKLNFIHTFRGKLARDQVRLFEKRYPFVRVEMADMGSQDAAERFIAEETAGRHLTDAISLAVPDMPVILKQRLVARYPTPETRRIPKTHQGFLDKEERWVPWYWSEHGISYNTNLIPPEKAPKSWQDLCNPAYKGQVSFDPPETRFMVGLYVMMGEEKLKAWMKCMGENQPIIQRGHTQRMNLMLAGDHAIQGDNFLYVGAEAKKKDPKTPYAIVYTAPILAYAGAMIINKNAPNPYAAALFTDWTLSDESQKYTADEWRGPLIGRHPYLPDNVKLVPFGYVSDDIVERLHGYWNQYIGKKK
ncbi:MAG TPA: ABC transporter substrate-binding protein [candidate division Zixibacteria bacterium]|nr:ABC transporter substrate-binding protein [candidate division Zixibacteria bacterium]